MDRSGKEGDKREIDSYRPLVEDQLAIEDQALIAYENLAAITRPLLCVLVAGQDEMIEAGRGISKQLSHQVRHHSAWIGILRAHVITGAQKD